MCAAQPARHAGAGVIGTVARSFSMFCERKRPSDTGQTGQPEVHERNVRPMVAVLPNRFRSAGRLRNLSHIGLVVDDGSDAFANQLVIVKRSLF